MTILARLICFNRITIHLKHKSFRVFYLISLRNIEKKFDFAKFKKLIVIFCFKWNTYYITDIDRALKEEFSNIRFAGSNYSGSYGTVFIKYFAMFVPRNKIWASWILFLKQA